MASDESSHQKVSRNKLNTICSSNEMSPKIWGNFPEELFEVVGARLPIASFFRFLSVSRKWNSMLTSHTFRDQYVKILITQPWFYTITFNDNDVNTATMYDPSSNKWHHPKIHFLYEELNIIPVASAGGMICFLNMTYMRFFVVNPLTQAIKEIPAIPGMIWLEKTVGMWMNGKSSVEGYKILYFNWYGQYFIFDSIGNTWSKLRTMLTSKMLHFPLKLNVCSKAISVDGCLYFMCLNPSGMISYNMLSGVWNHFLVPKPRDLIGLPILVECGGRIMLVSSRLSSIESFVSVRIWELQKMTLLWKEFDKMSIELWLESYGKNANMICIGNKDLIWFCFGSREKNMLVTYDVSKKEWFQVSGYMLPRGRMRQRIVPKRIIPGITFYPCITATP